MFYSMLFNFKISNLKVRGRSEDRVRGRRGAEHTNGCDMLSVHVISICDVSIPNPRHPCRSPFDQLKH